MNKKLKQFIKTNPGIFNSFEEFVTDSNVSFLNKFKNEFGEDALYFITENIHPEFLSTEQFKSIKKQINKIKNEQASSKQLAYLKNLISKKEYNHTTPLTLISKNEASELIEKLAA